MLFFGRRLLCLCGWFRLSCLLRCCWEHIDLSTHRIIYTNKDCCVDGIRIVYEWICNLRSDFQSGCFAAKSEESPIFMKVLERLSQNMRTVASVCVGFTPYVIAGDGCLLWECDWLHAYPSWSGRSPPARWASHPCTTCHHRRVPRCKC
jgi:hypothetical protein